jgi:hypothetical protein
MDKQFQDTTSLTGNRDWKGLYYAGGAAIVAMVVLFRRFFAVELIEFNGFGLFEVPDVTPISAVNWFAILQANCLLGLVLFGLFDIINYLLLGVVFLALYGALCETGRGLTILALSFGFVGIAVYVASNQAFAMLSLSSNYAAAETETQQALFLAAGEALLAIHNPGKLQQGTGIYLSFMLVLLAGLLISLAMLRSTHFHWVTAYAGIAANLLALGYFPALALGLDFIWVFPAFSAPFRMIWYILIAIGLFRLASRTA